MDLLVICWGVSSPPLPELFCVFLNYHRFHSSRTEQLQKTIHHRCHTLLGATFAVRPMTHLINWCCWLLSVVFTSSILPCSPHKLKIDCVSARIKNSCVTFQCTSTGQVRFSQTVVIVIPLTVILSLGAAGAYPSCLFGSSATQVMLVKVFKVKSN